MSSRLTRMLAERASSSPDHPFVIDGDRRLTYGETHAAAARVAGALSEAGVRPGDRVLLAMPNGLDFCAMLYGTLHAGAAAVLVNPRWTAYEIGSAIALTRPRLCIGMAASVSGTASPISMEAPSRFLAGASQSIEARENPTGTALMLMTSGTTGKPKAVMLSHEAVAANATQLARRKELTSRDRFLCSVPLFHSNGQVAALQSMLAAGSSLVLLERFSPEALVEYVRRYEITAITGVPTIYQQLVNFHERSPVDLSSLRLCISGSAPLTQSLFEEVERRFGAFILEGYGLTECSAGATGNPIQRRKPGTVGIALEGTELRVVDGEGREVPRGETGEVLIRGPQLMDGYFEDAEATRAAITPEGWLRSGDLASLDENDYLTIRSRKKELIIRGGFNVYPAEVESVLRGVEGVLEVAAIGLPDAVYGESVHGAVISELAPELLAERIRAECETKLARYKRPTSFSIHRDFPRTGSAKIQRTKLREELVADPSGVRRLG